MGKKGLRNLYIFTMCLAMFTKVPNVSLPWFWSYIHCALWIFLFFCIVRQKGMMEIEQKLATSVNTMVRVFATPYIVFVLFTLIGWAFYINETELNVITRAISNILQFSLMLGSVVATILIFKEKLLQYTFTAIGINYGIIILLAITKFGIGDFVKNGLLQFAVEIDIYNYQENSASILEVHDVTFAAGFFLIYYILWKAETKKKRWINILLSFALVYIGYKRVQLFALVIILLFMKMVKGKSRKSINFWSVIYTAVMAIVLLGFLWLIDSGLLGALTEYFGINTMGRVSAYSYMAEFFEVSPLYIGRGMSAAIRANLDLIASGVYMLYGHSDIMLNYIDYGFWGFLAWVIYCGYGATKRIEKKHGTESAKVWMLFTAYAFITYMTDNTAMYFAFQSCYMIIIFHTLYLEKKVNGDVPLISIGNRKVREK